MTDAWMTPEGGREDPERPGEAFDALMQPMVSRDAQTDARTMSEAAGEMSDELDMSGWLIDTAPKSIADEIRRNGWRAINSPSGGTPAPATTSGGRGAEDVGKI